MVKNIVIVGAGPAGLGAAHELTKGGLHKGKHKITILEKSDKVGGLAKTFSFKGSKFDIGPHRYFTKNDEVLSLWKKTLGRDFIKVKRLTRMYYDGKLFLYPVQFKDVITKLRKKDLFLVLVSYLYSQIFLRNVKPVSFEDWIVKNFGKRLYEIFFKTYTEKLWGISCSKISAVWADQRIKNLNFWVVAKNAILSLKNKKAKSLVEEFNFPVGGAGQMYERMAQNIKRKGATLYTNSEVVKIYHKGKRIEKVQYVKDGVVKTIKTDFLLSSIPLPHLVSSLIPLSSKDILGATKKLYFREHITVNLIVKGSSPFADNWIYVHAPEVNIVRISSFNNMSKAMAKDKNTIPLSVEYFAFKTDDLWKKKDKELIELAKAELEYLKLVRKENIVDGFVVRESDSYPVYYTGHDKYFKKIKDYTWQFENLELIGRGGMFKYDNMDHAIYSGMLAARNVLLGEKKYSTWSVNEDAEYLEEKP